MIKPLAEKTLKEITVKLGEKLGIENEDISKILKYNSLYDKGWSNKTVYRATAFINIGLRTSHLFGNNYKMAKKWLNNKDSLKKPETRSPLEMLTSGSFYDLKNVESRVYEICGLT